MFEGGGRRCLRVFLFSNGDSVFDLLKIIISFSMNIGTTFLTMPQSFFMVFLLGLVGPDMVRRSFYIFLFPHKNSKSLLLPLSSQQSDR